MDSQELEIPRNISDQLYDIILEKMISGVYRAGDRIDVSELVAVYKVSRSPVKDALNKLHGAGIIEISPRIGHYVRTLSQEDVIDIFELRLAVELMAARRARDIMDEADLAFLSSNLDESMALAKVKKPSMVSLYKLDRDFHRKIVALSNNAIIDSIHRTIHTLSHVARTLFANEAHTRTLESQKEHKLIADAFRTKEITRIEEAVTNHLKNAEKHILGQL